MGRAGHDPVVGVDDLPLDHRPHWQPGYDDVAAILRRWTADTHGFSTGAFSTATPVDRETSARAILSMTDEVAGYVGPVPDGLAQMARGVAATGAAGMCLVGVPRAGEIHDQLMDEYRRRLEVLSTAVYRAYRRGPDGQLPKRSVAPGSGRFPEPFKGKTGFTY